MINIIPVFRQLVESRLIFICFWEIFMTCDVAISRFIFLILGNIYLLSFSSIIQSTYSIAQSLKTQTKSYKLFAIAADLTQPLKYFQLIYKDKQQLLFHNHKIWAKTWENNIHEYIKTSGFVISHVRWCKTLFIFPQHETGDLLLQFALYTPQFKTTTPNALSNNQRALSSTKVLIRTAVSSANPLV